MKYLQNGRSNILLRIEFTPAAKRDLRQILNYTAKQYGKAQAGHYHGLLKKIISQLPDYPYMGATRDEIEPGCRSVACAEHVIFYRPQPAVIEVMRILHKHMNHPQHLMPS